MSTTLTAQIGRKNSTTVYTRPTTAAQISYFSRHGGKKNLYHSARQIDRLVWLIIATVGLHSVLLSLAPGIPQIETLSWVVALVAVAALHNLLEEVTKTFWFDRFEQVVQGSDGNTRDAADSSPILPILICLGLVAADYFGARTYLYSNIAPAQTADRAALSQEKTQALALERTDYGKQVAEIEQRFDGKKRAAAATATAEIRQWNAKQIISDNDRAWVSRGIASVTSRRDAALARLDDQRGTELAKARADFDAAKKGIEARANQAETRADDNDLREMSRVMSEQKSAHQFSWLISVFLMVLYMAFMYAEVRISALSGIFPVRNYTTLDAHGGFFEKLWKWLIVDVWQRFSHNFMVQAHERLAVRNLADFDGYLIEDLPTTAAPALPAPIAAAPAVDQPLPREVLLLRLEIGDLWKQVCEYGDANDEIAVWEKRRQLLEDFGYVSAPKSDSSVQFYAERISIAEMEKRHPLPRIRAFAPHPTRETAAVASPTAAQPVLELVETRPEPLSDTVGQSKTQNQGIVIADIEKWSQRARQCHRRTHPKNHEARSQEARAANAQRRDAYLECLALAGCTVSEPMTGETIADNDIDIRRPRPEVAAQMAGQNQQRLRQLLAWLGEAKEEI